MAPKLMGGEAAENAEGRWEQRRGSETGEGRREGSRDRERSRQGGRDGACVGGRRRGQWEELSRQGAVATEVSRDRSRAEGLVKKIR